MIVINEVDLPNVKTRHRTAAIPGTKTSVPNYPKKLKIYMNNASPYWWVTYYENGRTYRKSCKTTDKLEAYKQAKIFYESLILLKYQHPKHLQKHDISIQKKAYEKRDTQLKTIVYEWLRNKAEKWTMAHTKEVEKRLGKNLLKYFGEIDIRRISKNHLLNILERMESRGAFSLTRRLVNDCRKIWQYAIVKDICKNDITTGLSSVLKQHTVKHFCALGANELPKLMNDIASYEKNNSQIEKYALQLIALTFVRKNELLMATWNEFDLDKRVWKIPAERMKMRVEHTVPLSTQSIKLLQILQTKYPSNHYLFYKDSPTTPLVGHALIVALYHLGYKSRMTVHGFRSIASTILNENGFKSDVIERQLAHIEGNQVRRAYNRAEYLPERKEMMQWWGNYLEKISNFESEIYPETRLLF